MRTDDRLPATILDLIEAGDDADVAVEAAGRVPLDYAGLRSHTDRTRAALAGFGVGLGDRVAIVLPAGAEAATAFLSVASTAAAVPLNPGYRPAEFERLLPDLGVTAVLTSSAAGDPIHHAAMRRGLPVLHAMTREGGPAATFDVELASGSTGALPACASPRPDDPALVLHTSGTTSRPKIVPLRQRNLVAGAGNVAATLGLSAGDKCLAVMPLFHIHGLVASVLATLAAGGTLFCTDGFNAFGFERLLAASRATWTTAVPTMYQAVLARYSGTAHTLRLMRSSSVALPASLMRKLEARFETPVLEALGMTEASHQVAANPPPPGERRAGSVGVAAGAEVRVAGGELLIRGPGVFDGYESNPDANAAAFLDGWFRTGDLGSIGADGYVTLTGRIKELINRGGEKIGPREVEDVLLDHADIEQAVVFPTPHETLGEDVAAAVVLARGSDATEREIRSHVRERLAAFKVPKTIVIVDEIPQGPTGKPQRLTLAAQLGLPT